MVFGLLEKKYRTLQTLVVILELKEQILLQRYSSLQFSIYTIQATWTVLSIIGLSIVSIDKILTERMFSYLINLKFLNSYLLTSS